MAGCSAVNSGIAHALQEGVARIDRVKHDIDVMERVLSQARDTAPDEESAAVVQVTMRGMEPGPADILHMDEAAESRSTPDSSIVVFIEDSTRRGY